MPSFLFPSRIQLATGDRQKNGEKIGKVQGSILLLLQRGTVCPQEKELSHATTTDQGRRGGACHGVASERSRAITIACPCKAGKRAWTRRATASARASAGGSEEGPVGRRPSAHARVAALSGSPRRSFGAQAILTYTYARPTFCLHPTHLTSASSAHNALRDRHR